MQSSSPPFAARGALRVGPKVQCETNCARARATALFWPPVSLKWRAGKAALDRSLDRRELQSQNKKMS